MESPISLPQLLVARELITEDELERVTKLRDEQQAPLTRLVVELGIISEEDLLPVLHEHFNIPVMCCVICRMHRCRSTCRPAPAIFSSWRVWCR